MRAFQQRSVASLELQLDREQCRLCCPCPAAGWESSAADGGALGCVFTAALVCLMAFGQINPFHFLHVQSASTDLSSEECLMYSAFCRHLLLLQKQKRQSVVCKARFQLVLLKLVSFRVEFKNYLTWFMFYFPMEACASFIPTGTELCLLEISHSSFSLVT